MITVKNTSQVIVYSAFKLLVESRKEEAKVIKLVCIFVHTVVQPVSKLHGITLFKQPRKSEVLNGYIVQMFNFDNKGVRFVVCSRKLPLLWGLFLQHQFAQVHHELLPFICTGCYSMRFQLDRSYNNDWHFQEHVWFTIVSTHCQIQ